MDEFSYKLAYEALKKRLDNSPMPFLLGERVYFVCGDVLESGIILSGVMTEFCGNSYNIRTDDQRYFTKRASELSLSREGLLR